MARSSDIDFAKLVLIFNLAKREEIFNAIREVAFLQEQGIRKFLAHIVYEKRLLNKDQIQSILWALVCAGRIRKIPSRIVYEFTEEDDKVFLEKAGLPFNRVLEAIRKKEHLSSSTKKVFPQEQIIHCLDIQRKLRQRGFDRPLLSILSAKGHLRDQHNLIENLEDKKTILSSPKNAKAKSSRQEWEVFLYRSLTQQKCKLDDKKIEHALVVWRKIVDKYKIDIRYSEVLYFLGYMKKSDLNKIGVALEVLIGIEQTPRFHLFDMPPEEHLFVRRHVIDESSFQDRYRECFKITEGFKKLGLALFEVGNALLYKEYITRKGLKIRLKEQKSGMLESDFEELESEQSDQELAKYSNLLEGLPQGKVEDDFRDVHERWNKRERRRIAVSMIPFSVSELEKDLARQYVEERKASRRKFPRQLDSLVHQWSQTQTIPFFPTEDFAIQQGAIPVGVKPVSPTLPSRDVKLIDHTEYIPLETGAEEEPKIIEPKTQTEYIPLDASPQEIELISEKITHAVVEKRYLKTLFAVSFIISASTTIIESRMIAIFDKTDPIPIYSGLSMLMLFIPGIFFGNYFGKMADRGKVHSLFAWGLLTNAIFMAIVPFFHHIAPHLILRFFQGIGITAVAVGGGFCISRWFGPAERGKMLGIIAIVMALGATCGFLLCAILANPPETDLQNLINASITWSCVCLAFIPFCRRLRVDIVSGEDEEIDEEDIPMSKIPLIAASFYGIVEIGLFSVFFPTFTVDHREQAETLILILTVGTLLSSYFCGRLSDRIGSVPILRVLSLVAIINLCLVPFTITQPSSHLVFFFIGTVVGGLGPLGFSWLLESVDDERYFGAATGALSVYHGLGSIVGCLFCGIIFYHFEINGYFMVLALLFVAYLYLLLITPTKEVSIEEPRRLRGLLSFLEPTEEVHS